MTRLGKRERAALAGKAMRVRSITGCNLRVTPVDLAHGMRETIAYNPPVERLTTYARCRVMHNATGSDLRLAEKQRLHPPRFKG